MSIDWNRAYNRPNKSQKVKGLVLIDIKKKIDDLEKSLSNMKGRFESTKKNLDLASTQSFDTHTEMVKLKSQIEELFKENENLNRELKFSNSKIKELEQKNSYKKKNIESLHEDLLKRNKEIDVLNSKIENIIKENKDLTEKIKLLELVPNILEKIKDIMIHKGFLSDQELYDIEEEVHNGKLLTQEP